MHPQALPLRSYLFQKVGKKPELTLVWEPEDVAQEPAQQVRPGGGAAFPEHHWVPVHPALGAPPPASWGALPGPPLLGSPCPRLPAAISGVSGSTQLGRQRLPLTTPWAWLSGSAFLPRNHPPRGEAGASACLPKAGPLTLGGLLRI